ncbi:hypothetical protein V6N11_037686 [Hibiscus sabdariffa]|uniref:Uncharacterized protein n=1 Tax=Hibiscus sabdariffa TaxID=183260 RepID=A0ABR2PCD5_9ROSI
MKMENAFYVELEGIAGGLALWWSIDVKLTVLQYDKNFINTIISINWDSEWFGTFIYALPYEEEKQSLWEKLTTIRIAVVDVAIASDHASILLLTNGMEKRAKKYFKFESKRLLEEDWPRIVKEEWVSARDSQQREMNEELNKKVTMEEM